MGVVPGDRELMVSWEGWARAGPRLQLSWAAMRMLGLGVNFPLVSLIWTPEGGLRLKSLPILRQHDNTNILDPVP